MVSSRSLTRFEVGVGVTVGVPVGVGVEVEVGAMPAKSEEEKRSPRSNWPRSLVTPPDPAGRRGPRASARENTNWFPRLSSRRILCPL